MRIDRKRPGQGLASAIREEIIIKGRKATFIDCRNRIDQYMFRRDEVETIMDSLFLCRMDRFFDFLECLESIHDDPYFKRSQTLILSSWEGLMDGMDADDKAYYQSRVRELLEGLGRKGKNIIVDAEGIL